MKNKIIFYGISLIIAIIIKPIFGFIIEAKDCKSDLESLKLIEENDKKFHQKKIEKLKYIKTKKYDKKTDYNFSNNIDNDFLLEQLK